MTANGTPSRNEIERRVIHILECFEKIDPNKLSPYASLVDLGLDSLDCVEIAMSLEDEFSIEIPDNESDKIKTVNGIVDYFLTKAD